MQDSNYCSNRYIQEMSIKGTEVGKVMKNCVWEEAYVSSYWLTFRKREDTGIWNKKY